MRPTRAGSGSDRIGDLFAQGYLPLFLTKDVDGALFSDKGIYTPSLQIGMGVGF